MSSFRLAGITAGLTVLAASSLLAAPVPTTTDSIHRATAVNRAELLRVAPGLSPRVLDLALAASDWARMAGAAARPDVVTVIDYSLPSTQPRLWVLDLERGRLLFHELVAHGAGTGENLASRFSNREGSRQTSLGLFVTGGTYQGGNGYSLRLHGLEAGINDRAFERTVVVHGAWYVSAEHAGRWGRLGRSWGCPALPLGTAGPVIDAIKGGTLLFAYYPETTWLGAAPYASDVVRAQAAPAAAATMTAKRGSRR